MRSPTLYLVAVLLAAPASAADMPAMGNPPADERIALTLTDAERALVIAQMRQFLAATQQIASALSTGDTKAAAAAARPLGMGGPRHVTPSLRQKFPDGFRQMANATHMSFDDLARDAESLGDPSHAMGQLAEVLGNCMACHAVYRAETVAGRSAR